MIEVSEGHGVPLGRAMMPLPSVGQLPEEARGADPMAPNGLTPLLYKELRRLARRHMFGQRRGHTLRTTELVNEAYLKLANLKEPEWTDRVHFLSVASRAMRSVLVDYARKRRYAKRGSDPVRVSLTDARLVSEQASAEALAIDEALKRLSQLDPRKSQIVELRYFGGLGIEQTAEVLAISTGTVNREWNKARAWLRRELRQGQIE
jgi:RNA polymerase sigma factor (TIGR02999 family)